MVTAQQLELRRVHREAERPGIVDVGADIGVEDDLDRAAAAPDWRGPSTDKARTRQILPQEPDAAPKSLITGTSSTRGYTRRQPEAKRRGPPAALQFLTPHVIVGLLVRQDW